MRISRRTLLGIVAAASMAAACAIPAVAQDGASEADVVRVGAVPVSGQTDIHVAKSLGFFDEEGLNVEIVKVRSGAEAQAAVVSGNLEFIGVNAVSMILGLHEGFDFVAAADGFRAPRKEPGTAAIVVRNDGSVKAPKDLEGKRLGIVTRRGLHELYLVDWARKHDVNLEAVTIMEVAYPQMVDTLISDQVDAVIPLEPFIGRGMQSGKIEVLSYYDTEIDPGHANGLWVGMGSWAKAHPNATTKFQKAINRAHQYLNDNPDKRLQLTAEWTGLDPELLKEIAEDEFATDMPVASVQKQADTMLDLGWLKKPVNVSTAFWQP